MSNIIDIIVPDIDNCSDILVVEISTEIGATIEEEDTILVLESDKAALDVPSTANGIVREILVAEGERVSAGTLIARIESNSIAAPTKEQKLPSTASEVTTAPLAMNLAAAKTRLPATSIPLPEKAKLGLAYASPSIRKFARELGVDISTVKFSGIKDRITREDVANFVKNKLQSPAISGGASSGGTGLDLPPWPIVDFAKFGTVSRQPLSRIAKISGPSLARNAIIIPHVTNFENADITDLEEFRKTVNTEAKDGFKISILAFVVKASVAALKEHPKFNSSLDGNEIVLKEYYHIGVAVDTLDGLVVLVIKGADKKSIRDIAAEMGDLAADARNGKLKPTDMQGGTFTISSLGKIGATNFTPIINAPEVAILGMAGSSIKPIWDGNQFQPRLIQPMSLSWDHRVVDGVAAARFLKTVQAILEDFRRISL